MPSSTSSAKHASTVGEEEESDASRYRYIPRTLLQGRAFYEPAIHGLSSDSSSSDNSYGNSRGSSAKSVRRTKHDDDNEPRWNSQFLMHQTPASNNLTAQHLNVPRDDLFEDISNDSDPDPDEHDNGSQAPHNNESKPQTRNLDLDDLDIKSIHGRNHYGKLETTPTADHQDRLWTQIDALDDVKKMASNMDLYEDFQPGFEEQLSKLRLAHSRLLKMMRDKDSLLNEERNKTKIGNDGDSDNNFDQGISSTTNRLEGDPTTGKTESHGSNDSTTASSSPIIPYPSTDRETGTGAVSNLTADANVKPSSSLKSIRRATTPSSIPSRIQIDEDKYVQDIIGIIKQLRV